MGASYRERGQLILVTAVSLAAVFVTVALVLNSAIYTENVATRTNQQEPREATSFQQSAVTGAGGGLDHVHHNNSSHASYTVLETEMESQLVRWTELNMRDAAREGKLVEAEYLPDSAVNGTRVAQNDGTAYGPQNLSAVNGTGTGVDTALDSWVVATDVSRIRTFEMTVNRNSLQTEAQGDVETYLGNLETDVSLGTPPFTTVYDENADGTLDHAFAIYESDDGSNDIKITHRDIATDTTETCTVEDAPTEFDVSISEQRVTGAEDCKAVFAFVSDLASPYRVSYVEGDQVTGEYEFIIDADNTEFASQMSALGPSFSEFYETHNDGHDDSYDPTSPFIEPAFYSVGARVVYRSGTVKYETAVTIAPEEPE